MDATVAHPPCEFNWRLMGVSGTLGQHELNGREISSPSFNAFGGTFVVNVYPNGITHEHHDSISVRIVLCTPNLVVDLDMLRVRVEGIERTAWAVSLDNEEDRHHSSFGWNRFSPRQSLCDNGEGLIVRVTMSHTPTNYVEPTQSKKALAPDILRMLTERQGCDMEVVCGPLTLPAHSFVLRARSRVANMVLDRGTGPSMRLSLDPTFEPVVAQFLSFMYTDTLNPGEHARAHLWLLLRAADFYEVPALQSAVEPHLRCTTTVDTVLTDIAEAKTFHSVTLFDYFIMFAAGNAYHTSMMAGLEWLAFMKAEPELACEVTQQMAGVRKARTWEDKGAGLVKRGRWIDTEENPAKGWSNDGESSSGGSDI